MDLATIIIIIIGILLIYFFIRFVVSPVIRAILGVIIFIFLIYLLQRYLGFDFNKVLSTFGISFDTNKLGFNFDWLSGPINYFGDKIQSYANFLLKNIPSLPQK